MGVDSYLEIYTTLYGWFFANLLLQPFIATGIYLLPVLFNMVGAFLDAHKDGFDGETAARMIRTIEGTIFIFLFMFIFCVKPWSIPATSLSRIGLTYTPAATVIDPAPVTVTGADTHSTYDTTLGSRADVAAVPPWWMMVMLVSSGISTTVRSEIQTGMADMRTLHYLAATARVSDITLRMDMQRFYTDCFVPSRSRFLRTLPPSPEAAAALAQYGSNDVDWIGSHVYRDDPEFYQRYWAVDPVVGFIFNINNYADSDLNEGETPPAWGRPSCKQWWEADVVGLRAKMARHVGWPVGSPTQLGTALANLNPLMSEDERMDNLARLAYVKDEPRYIDPAAILGNDRRWYDSAAAAPGELLGVVGTGWEWAKFNASLMPLINLFLMVQPMILMAMYMLLPLAVIFSGYSPKMFVTGAVAIFTVKFWVVLWTIARWLDDHLIRALNEPDLFVSLFDIADHGFKRAILNILLVTMFFGMPLLWTAMMGWAGHQLGRFMGMLEGAKVVGDNAGSEGVRAGRRGGKV